MGSGRWGALASFGSRTYPGTKRMYGTSGNSFVAVVEFGDRVEAFAVTAGGESGDPSSPHFNDQAQNYADGNLRPVYYYPEDIEAHAEETYRPGGRYWQLSSFRQQEFGIESCYLGSCYLGSEQKLNGLGTIVQSDVASFYSDPKC